MALEGKVVLVTGGSSGIGRAIAIAAARAGADVAITYRGNVEGAAETARDIAATGRRSLVVRADVSREADIDGVAVAVREQFGRVDAWINNAGADILTGKGATLSRLEKLDLLLAVDLRGTVLASWAAVDLMRAQGGGVIINTSWDHVTLGLEGENPILYSAAKGGIMSFSKSLAREVAPEIRVNILAPGFIDTAFGREEASTDWRRAVEARTPLGRWGTPEDVAKAAVFLASEEAAFMTGQMLMVNGGVVM
ncbi:MAG TPA: SDR family oxidoreductase [Gemmatimonadales bacterium]|nr:SDR family oxidoreductase [Gemmatimonadales bacterium]